MIEQGFVSVEWKNNEKNHTRPRPPVYRQICLLTANSTVSNRLDDALTWEANFTKRDETSVPVMEITTQTQG